MNENEIMMNDEVTEVPEVIEEEERSGMSTGLAVLIGAGLALAGAKAFKFAKKKYEEFKAKTDGDLKKAETPEDSKVVQIDSVEENSDK